MWSSLRTRRAAGRAACSSSHGSRGPSGTAGRNDDPPSAAACYERSTPPTTDPLHAVLAPPNAARLRARLAVAPDAPVELATTGWCKVVVLVEDLAVLVPRNHQVVRPLRREITALDALRDVGLPGAPGLRKVIEDDAICPYPLAVTDRVPGVSLETAEPDLADDAWDRVLRGLGAALATVHSGGARRLRHRDPAPHRAIVHGLLDHDRDARRTALVAAAAAVEVEVDDPAIDELSDALADASRLAGTVVHNDLHEAQVMVDGGEVTGIVDWQTASVDHPFVDYDLLQWGVGALRRFEAVPPERHRRALWEGARGDERHGRATGGLLDLVWALNDGWWAATRDVAPVTALPLARTLRGHLAERARGLLAAAR